MNLETIQNALEKLPVKFREIILLSDWEEMSYQEISETLGIPTGTVMSRLSRARKAMRELLAANYRGLRDDLRSVAGRNWTLTWTARARRKNWRAWKPICGPVPPAPRTRSAA